MNRKSVIVCILFVCIINEVFAREIFNRPIVETWQQMIGRDEFHYAGVDITGDGFSDLFITVPYINHEPFLRRLAGLLREGSSVSFDDQIIAFSQRLGANTLEPRAILEINGRSVIDIFPNNRGSFSLEIARQERLRLEANTQATTPSQPAPQMSTEDRVAELEAELERLRSQNQQ